MNQRRMMRAAACWVALMVLAAGCQARQRMLDAAVRQTGELPCFTVAGDAIGGDKALRVSAVEVNEITQRGAVVATPWSAGMREQIAPTTLTAATCIAYGSIAGPAPAEVLAAGKRYAVFINAYAGPRGRAENRRYSSYFCLTAGADGRTEVHQLVWDPVLHDWNWAPCGIPVGR